jgi:iron(III) transport system permease protein
MSGISLTRLRTRKAVNRTLGLVSVVALTFLFLMPIGVLILSAFRSGSAAKPGPWDLTGFLETMANPTTWIVVLNSVVLAVASTVIAVVVGGFLAWVAVKTTTPLRRIMTPTMAGLMLLPALFYGLGWVLMTRGTNAPLTKIFQWLGFDAAPASTGWIPLVLIVAGFVIPVAYMFLLGPISGIDGSLEEAARVNGASRAKVVWTVTIPLLKPSLLGVFVLMTSYSFSAFELPLLFGTPAGLNVFSTAVYSTMSGSIGVPNHAGAATLSIILILLVTLLVSVRSLLSRRAIPVIGGKGYKPEPTDYGRAQIGFLAVFIITALLIGVLPLLQMIIGSFQPMFGLSGFTLDNYARLLKDPSIGDAIGVTLFLSVLGGLLATAIAVPLSYLAARRGGWVSVFAGLVSWAPASVPGVIVGLALLSAYLPIPGLRNLFGTVWLLLIGFAVVVIPITTRAVEGSIGQISKDLEDSSRISGAGPYRTFFSVVVRLISRSFFAGWFLAGLMISGNLSLPALLSSPAMQTVAVKAYSFYSLGETSRAAALFLLLMAVVLATALALFLVLRLGKLLVVLGSRLIAASSPQERKSR